MRVTFAPYLSDRAALARACDAARVVVMPGAHETFGLVALEAAASGAPVVCRTTAPASGAPVVCFTTAPAARIVGDLAHTFRPGDRTGLVRAIEDAAAVTPVHDAARRMAAENSWAEAFRAEAHEIAGRIRTAPVS